MPLARSLNRPVSESLAGYEPPGGSLGRTGSPGMSKGAPASIVQKLRNTAAAALDTPSFRDRLRGFGVEVVAPDRRSPDYLARYLKDDIAKWTAPIKASGATVE